MAELFSNVAVQNITVPPLTTMLDHLTASNPHPQYVLLADFPAAVSNLVTLSNIRDVIVPNSDINDNVLAWKNAAWRPTPISEILDMDDLPDATTLTKGAVRLAATIDITNRSVSTAVTPDGMRKFLDDNGYTDAVTQKLQVARTKEQVIASIEAHSTNVISGMELDGGDQQYVQVLFPKSAPNNAISADTSYASSRYAKVSSAINQSYADILVYKNGIVEDYVLKDELSSATGAGYVRRPLSMVLHSDASAYDLTIKNSNYLIVHNNAKVNRVMVSSNGIMYTYGTAHDVKLVGNSAGTDEAQMVVDSNGHAEYLSISRGGRVLVYNGGIIEHVQAMHTFAGGNCAVQITDTGKAYHVVLTSANAIVYSGGYMEDVALYDGAFLTVESGAVIKDLKAYQNANIEIHDGAKIEGLVRYQPSVTLTDVTEKGLNTVIEAGAICHTKKMPIYQMSSQYVSTDYHESYIQSGAGYQSAGVTRQLKADEYTWTRFVDGRAVPNSEYTPLPPAKAFYPDVAPHYVAKVTTYSEYYNTAGSKIDSSVTDYISEYDNELSPNAKIWVPAFEPPKGFLRVMPEAVHKLDNATAETMAESGAELYSSAYQFHLVQSITNYRPTGDPDVVLYSVIPPEDFVETFNSNYEWYVTF